MANYRVRFEKNAQDALCSMSTGQANLMLAWIKRNLLYTDDPRHLGKKLSKNFEGRWLYPLGDYRIVADIADSKITVMVLDIRTRTNFV